MNLPKIYAEQPCLIGKIKNEFGSLSNMSKHPIVYNNTQWSTAENLFQALRFNNSHPIYIEIFKEKNPMRAKILARHHSNDMIISPRSNEDLINMKLVLSLKLNQYPEIGDLLKSTQNRTIIEDCTRRASESGLFWGAKRVFIPAGKPNIEQIAYLRGLSARNMKQELALIHLVEVSNRKEELYWKGHNWLGRTWMWLRETQKTQEQLQIT